MSRKWPWAWGEKTCVSPGHAIGQLCDLGYVPWPLGCLVNSWSKGINCSVFFTGLLEDSVQCNNL